MGQTIVVMGYILDTLLFEMRIPEEKLEVIRKLLINALYRRSLRLWDVQVLAGYLAWASPAIQLGWVFCKKIWEFQRKFTPGRAHQYLTLPPQVVQDLKWWQDALDQSNGTRFFYDDDRTSNHLYTNASGYAMGGFFYTNGSLD